MIAVDDIFVRAARRLRDLAVAASSIYDIWRSCKTKQVITSLRDCYYTFLTDGNLGRHSLGAAQFVESVKLRR